jgi:hypothetical protein
MVGIFTEQCNNTLRDTVLSSICARDVPAKTSVVKNRVFAGIGMSLFGWYIRYGFGIKGGVT